MRFVIVLDNGARHPYQCDSNLEDLAKEIAESDVIILDNKIAVMCKKVVQIEELN